ncbi:uncharacterized protein LOC128214765 isoform X1 [Mya arenaria]|uniref:uncharacterized protein LOC128214765 isoform X1 n=1 Tax=Mya arenaria TaxID=6604 RepID=UPI0022E115B2|nr:uncharacterized protein LOC128214765 isoform X1 [Mya arenaria]
MDLNFGDYSKRSLFGRGNFMRGTMNAHPRLMHLQQQHLDEPKGISRHVRLDGRQGVVNELKRLVNTYRSTDYLNWWVGLEFGGEPAQCRWVSDEEFNSKLTDWAPAQPGAPADCAMFDYQGYLLEEDCELQHPFICEQNRTALTNTTAATTSTSTVAPVTSTGEMVTEQEFTSGGPEISTVRTGQPTTQHTTPDVGPNQPTRNHTDEPTELPDVSNQTSGTPRPDSGSGSRNDPNVSTTVRSWGAELNPQTSRVHNICD